MTVASSIPAEPDAIRPNLDRPAEPKTVWAMIAIGLGGLAFAAWSIYSDLGPNAPVAKLWPFMLLGLALLIALGFEFVNGFHDTANAVATVIYTHSLPAVLRRGVVRPLQLSRRSHLQRRRRLRHHFAAAGRTDPAGRLRRRLLHGVRAADRRDHLESGNLVVRPAGLLLAHADRLDHRRRRRQRDAARSRRHLGRGLGQGHRNRLRAAAVAVGRLPLRRRPAAAHEVSGAQEGAL